MYVYIYEYSHWTLFIQINEHDRYDTYLQRYDELDCINTVSYKRQIQFRFFKSLPNETFKKFCLKCWDQVLSWLIRILVFVALIAMFQPTLFVWSISIIAWIIQISIVIFVVSTIKFRQGSSLPVVIFFSAKFKIWTIHSYMLQLH